MKIQILFALASVACFQAVRNVDAGTIDPVSATSPDTYYGFGPTDTRSPDHTIDSSGLTGGLHTSDVHATPGNDGTMWLSDVVDPTITWDLGGIINLTGFHLWNYNEANNDSNGRGIKTTDIQVSATGLVGSWTDLHTYPSSFTEAPGADGYAGEDYALAVNGVRFVQFNVLSTFSNDGAGAGLAEIRFTGNFVPEPSSLALAACALVGLSLFRRRQNGR